jgi:hypothetical protein
MRITPGINKVMIKVIRDEGTLQKMMQMID